MNRKPYTVEYLQTMGWYAVIPAVNPHETDPDYQYRFVPVGELTPAQAELVAAEYHGLRPGDAVRLPGGMAGTVTRWETFGYVTVRLDNGQPFIAMATDCVRS